MATDMKYCRKCGTENKRDAKFCRKCGTEFSMSKAGESLKPAKEEKYVCEYCRQMIEPGAVKCSYCGAEVPETVIAKMSAAAVTKKSGTVAEPIKRQASPKKTSSATDQGSANRANEQGRTAAKQKKIPTASKGFVWNIKTRIIAAAMALVLLFTAFIEPGFLRKKKPWVETSQEQEATTLASAQGGQEAGSGSQGQDDYPTLTVQYTIDQIENAPEVTTYVSDEETDYKCGDVEVVFDAWQLENGVDELTVRDLPEITDSESGVMLKAWDFSLLSGQHEFETMVEVHLPRPKDIDERTLSCVWFNEDTGEWEDKYFEVSEDGEYYIIYTNHFSKGGFSWLKSILSGSREVEDEDPTKAMFPAKLLYYKDGSNLKDPMNAKVALNMKEYWQYIESISYDDPTFIASYLFEDPEARNEEGKNLWNAGLTCWFGFTNGVTSKDGISVIVNKAEYLDSIRNLSKFDKTCNFGSVVAAADLLLISISVWRDVAKDKREFKKALQDAWANHARDAAITLASTTATALLVDNPVGLAITAGATVLLGVLCMHYDNPYQDEIIRLSTTELTYENFYRRNLRGISMGSQEITENYYEDRAERRYQLSQNARTSELKAGKEDLTVLPVFTKDELTMEPLPNLDEDENEILRKQLKKKPLRYNGKGWPEAFALLCDFAAGDKERLDTLIEELYMEYAEVFWRLTPERRERIAETTYSEFDRTDKFEEPKGAGDRYDLILKFVMRMEEKTDDILAQKEKNDIILAREEHQRIIKKTLIPTLNTKLIFSVKDGELKDGQTFDKSLYARDPLATGHNSGFKNSKNANYSDLITYMRFDCAEKPQVLPKNVSADLYYPVTDSFIPKARKNSNVVFECTVFHYIMMGAPQNMIFYDSLEYDEAKRMEHSQSVTMKFPEKIIPKEVNYVDISINSPSESDLLWSLEKIEYRTDEYVFITEGAANNFNNSWYVVNENVTADGWESEVTDMFGTEGKFELSVKAPGQTVEKTEDLVFMMEVKESGHSFPFSVYAKGEGDWDKEKSYGEVLTGKQRSWGKDDETGRLNGIAHFITPDGANFISTSHGTLIPQKAVKELGEISEGTVLELYCGTDVIFHYKAVTPETAQKMTAEKVLREPGGSFHFVVE